jgi:class 3 adenylate cyclase
MICASKIFAGLTMSLTFYALFGDDMRLIFTAKKEDTIFDWITITAMSMFSIEIVAFIGGKPEYLFGFFFWLDILSTVTLILDVTVVGEQLFGDSISKASSSDDSSGGGGAGDSAEAARAARMSRAGTKAGRVVRLIRLLRLIKMLKVFKKDNHAHLKSYPGDDMFDDDEDDANIQESAVSKKLSEMTTRRVIILVLTIMLSLPLFRPEMYNDTMDNAGQYGLNILYRRWRDGLYAEGVDLATGGTSIPETYFATTNRQVYEDLFLLYLYKHNWFVKGSEVPSGKSSPTDSFNRIFWLGVAPSGSPLGQYMLPRHSNYDWNSKWNGQNWDFYSGDIPWSVQSLFRDDWMTSSTLCVYDLYRGISLLADEDPAYVCPEELRYQERTVIFPQYLTSQEREQITFMFVFDRRSGSSFEAQLNTFQTLFVCLLLSVGSMTFASDANKLVLAPIERMISKLDRIRNNPLEALKIGDEEQHRQQLKTNAYSDEDVTQKDKGLKGKCRKFLRIICPCCKHRLGGGDAQAVPEPMETQVLERTIVKIGSLLALGFGEAGAQIIGQNMKDNDSSAVMGVAPGRRVEAVFGFCDIRSFTDTMEILQDQVMIFVNRIAAIVHSVCDEFWGSPNKNVGDAFLLVWRLSELEENKHRAKLVDFSLLGLANMIGKLSLSSDIAEYRSHAKLCKRMPGYQVRVGFGLHLGWAIEGAIGSEFKIDASYLSPNVNITARLGHDTKYYGAHILFSEAVNSCLSEQIRDECRLIDYVDLSGGAPTKIYTIDLDDTILHVEYTSAAATTKASKFKQRMERQRRKLERWTDEYSCQKLFAKDELVGRMRETFTEEFFCRFKMAYLNYEAGNWPIARTMLQETRFLLTIEDGASCALLRLIQMYGGQAPKDWNGYRKFGIVAKEPLRDTFDATGSVKTIEPEPEFTLPTHKIG